MDDLHDSARLVIPLTRSAWHRAMGHDGDVCWEAELLVLDVGRCRNDLAARWPHRATVLWSDEPCVVRQRRVDRLADGTIQAGDWYEFDLAPSRQVALESAGTLNGDAQSDLMRAFRERSDRLDALRRDLATMRDAQRRAVPPAPGSPAWKAAITAARTAALKDKRLWTVAQADPRQFTPAQQQAIAATIAAADADVAATMEQRQAQADELAASCTALERQIAVIWHQPLEASHAPDAIDGLEHLWYDSPTGAL